jgi:predicted SnoaL-like aldol condensation-catalyzing enzyme
MSHNLEANKQNAIAFYQTAYLGDPSGAVENYVGAEYIQHNPLVADGAQAFIDYFSKMTRDYPSKSIEFIRAVAEDDLVALHTHQTWPGNEQYVTMDFFRFDDNGKIVEHWDAIQPVPDESRNGNSMY